MLTFPSSLRLPFSVSPTFLFFLAVGFSSGQAQEKGTWSTAAVLPVIQSEWDGAALGDSIFCMGGEMKRTPKTDETKASDELWIYNAKTDKWTQGANMPESRNHISVVALNGLIYAFGGYPPPCCKSYPWPAGTNTAWSYNPKTNTWATLAPIPRKFGAGIAVAFKDKIYVMAGTDSGGYHSITAVHEYNPTTNTWVAKASMKNAREHTRGVVVDSMIYVFGGHQKPGATRTNQGAVEAYSPSSNTWIDKGVMPTPRGAIGGAYIDGKVYLFGGEGADFALFNIVDQYDPATGKWAVMANTPGTGGIHGMATVTYNGKVHLIGGSNPSGFNPKDYHNVYTPPAQAQVSVKKPLLRSNRFLRKQATGPRNLSGRIRAPAR